MSSSRAAMLKRWPGWALLLIVVVAFLAVGTSRSSGPRTPEERVEAVAKRLACPICDGESVFESRNNASNSIRNDIKSKVAEGRLTDDQIVTELQNVYTARVLLVPKATGLDALVWVLPVAAFVCAIAGLAVAFRRWKRVTDTVPSDDDRELVAAAMRRAEGSGTDVAP